MVRNETRDNGPNPRLIMSRIATIPALDASAASWGQFAKEYVDGPTSRIAGAPARRSRSRPIPLLTHDQPNLDTKHLRNPNGDHGLNGTDKFENMVVDEAVDPDKNGKSAVDGPSTTRRRELVDFPARHKNIVAYFHGRDSFNEHHVWKGPDENIALNVFRVDSAMKGDFSAQDESKLSHQLVTVDSEKAKMAVREVLRNAPETWGASGTVPLAKRER